MKQPASYTLSVKVYALMLRLYPQTFRQEYEAEMLRLFKDCLCEVSRQGNLQARRHLWVHTFFDWLGSLLVEHIQEIFQMSLQSWMMKAGAIAAVLGGVLGLYLLGQGQNSYGNYGWEGNYSIVASLLLTIASLSFWQALAGQLSTKGHVGMMLTALALGSMVLGKAVESLWMLAFIGLLMILPVGQWLVYRSLRTSSINPSWWLTLPLLVTIGAVVGFVVELVEDLVFSSSELDLGAALVLAVLSICWPLMGLGMWQLAADNPNHPTLA